MLDFNKILQQQETLDPDNWEEHKALAHKMIDDFT